MERTYPLIVGSAMILTLALTTLLSTSADAKTKIVPAPENVKTHGLTNCEMKPQACAPICGTASPSCEMSGQCICRLGPHKTGPNCTEPEGLEAKKCHRDMCLRTKITRPLVCHLTKKLKMCACFPDSAENSI